MIQERTHFEREISTLLGESARSGPRRQYDISARVTHSQTIGFEFDVHYGFIDEVITTAGRTAPANNDVVTTHTEATDFFKVKRDGPRLEIATKPFTTDKAGEAEIGKCFRGIAKFAESLKQGCGSAKEKSISVAGVTGKPRPFPLPSGLDPLLPIVKLPLGGRFDADCRVWASPQATITLPIWKVDSLVTEIKKSEGKGAGVALTGSKGQRMGVQSEAIYRAQAAVSALKKELIKDKVPVKALGNKAFDDTTFSDRLGGFLILLASYLITSELPYRFEDSAPKHLRDYEPFAKAYLPLNVKAPFPEIFYDLLFPDDQMVFKEMFAHGDARKRLFSLAKPGAVLADGDRKLFPTGPKEGSDDSVHFRQQLEFGSVPTWNDLVEHTLDPHYKGWGTRLLVPISHPIVLDKTYPLFAVEMRRIGFASVFAWQWPGMVGRILKLARILK